MDTDKRVLPPIDNANNLVFWCRFLNKLEPWYTVNIMQHKQNTLILT